METIGSASNPQPTGQRPTGLSPITFPRSSIDTSMGTTVPFGSNPREILCGLHEIICRFISATDRVRVLSFCSWAFGSWPETGTEQAAVISANTCNPRVDMGVCYLAVG